MKKVIKESLVQLASDVSTLLFNPEHFFTFFCQNKSVFANQLYSTFGKTNSSFSSGGQDDNNACLITVNLPKMSFEIPDNF